METRGIQASVTTGKAGGGTPTLETEVAPDTTYQQDRINNIIHEGLTDLWLLLTGEELTGETVSVLDLDGHPFAMICGGEVRLMGSRRTALKTLRSCGIEMS
jgi:hypothetical protein